jgi:hypothetical protein
MDGSTIWLIIRRNVEGVIIMSELFYQFLLIGIMNFFFGFMIARAKYK